jgi:hypothetical protein
LNDSIPYSYMSIVDSRYDTTGLGFYLDGYLAFQGTSMGTGLQVGKNISSEEPDTSYWGFCVGRRIFVRYLYSFFQLERKDGGLYISPTFDARRRDINNSALNLLIGLAALSGSVAAHSGPEFGGFNALNPVDIPLVILPGKEYLILGLQLDWTTGGVTY